MFFQTFDETDKVDKERVYEDSTNVKVNESQKDFGYGGLTIQSGTSSEPFGIQSSII